MNLLNLIALKVDWPTQIIHMYSLLSTLQIQMLIQQEDIQLLLVHHYIVAKSLVAQLGHSWCFQMRRLGFKSSLPRPKNCSTLSPLVETNCSSKVVSICSFRVGKRIGGVV